MQFKKVFKGMLVAIPVVTMMACSTTDQSAVDEQAAAAAAAAQAEEDRKAREAEEQRIQVAQANERRVAQQNRERELESLKNDQVVYFDFDRSSIRGDSYAVLDKHAEFLSKNPGQSIVIEGHCDSRGTPSYNIALGERRAKAVETYLQNAGVNASQISVVSYGEEKPAVAGTSEDAFAKNRRGVLVYQ